VLLASVEAIPAAKLSPARKISSVRKMETAAFTSGSFSQIGPFRESLKTHKFLDIVWNVSYFSPNSFRKSVWHKKNFPWLTGTALEGGHGVEVFSQM
jgi:hypothetical protein